MNEKQLGSALLNWDATGTPPGQDPRQMVANLLRRDARRVRWLAAGTVFFWMISAAGIPLFFILFLNFVYPKMETLISETITHRRGVDPSRLEAAGQVLLAITWKLSVVLVTGSVIALLLAACMTVMLVFASRRATLRQVNANLAEISEQLKRLRPS
jgi:hypothetical protein